MPIASLNDYIAAAKQNVSWTKTGALTTVATVPFSPFAVAGGPGAGTLAAGNTANGLVPTSATAGYPVLNAFGVGATGYVTRIRYASSVACRIMLFDRVFTAGAYAFNANTNLASQPSFSARLPGGSFRDLEFWCEQVTVATGIQSVTLGYEDEDAVARTTPTQSQGTAGIVGRCWQIPTTAGATGISKLTNVTGSVATVGTFNVNILRRLAEVRVASAGGGGVLDLTQTGMPEVFASSALYCMVACDSTSLGLPDLTIEIANR